MRPGTAQAEPGRWLSGPAVWTCPWSSAPTPRNAGMTRSPRSLRSPRRAARRSRSSSWSTTTRSLYQRLKSDTAGRDRGGEPRSAGALGRQEHRRRHGQRRVVAFLDDDAVAEPDWLKFFADSYAGGAVAGVGGLTLPLLGDHAAIAGSPRSSTGWSAAPTSACPPPAPVRNLLGGNASFRREAFTLAGGFRSGIGRSGRRLPLGCEETEFCIRLGQRSPGTVLLFDNRAVIWHRVPTPAAGSPTSSPGAMRRDCPRHW